MWLTKGPTVGVLAGFSGVGKSTAAAKLVAESGMPSIHVPAARDGLGAEDVLFEVALALENIGDTTMSGRPDGDFYAGLRQLMGERALVVIDQFENLLDANTSMPGRKLWDTIIYVSEQPVKTGRLLLVTGQELPRGPWQGAVAMKTMGPPEEDDATRFLGKLLADTGREEEVPPARRAEVVRWLGRNPRALQALVACLADDSLDELIELEPDSWALRDQIVSPQLVDQLELWFRNRTLEKLDIASLSLVELLSVYRRPFTKDAIERLGPRFAVARATLSRNFMLEHKQQWFSLNRVAREIARSRLTRSSRPLAAAHNHAADHYARHFKATGGTDIGRHAADFIEARYHLFQADRDREFEDIARSFRTQLLASYGTPNSVPTDKNELRQLIATLAAALDNETPPYVQLRHLLARLLVRRNQQGDKIRALRQLTLATRTSLDPGIWVLRLRVAFEVEGLSGLDVVADQAIARLPKQVLTPIYYYVARTKSLLGRVDDAMRLVNRGIVRCAENRDLYELYQLKTMVLIRMDLPNEALSNLVEFLKTYGPVQPNKRTFEQAASIALSNRDVGALRTIERIASTMPGAESAVALCELLVLESLDQWEKAATLDVPETSYLPFLAHQAFCLLCCGRPSEALERLTSASARLYTPSMEWLWALIAYCNRQIQAAIGSLETLLHRQVEPSEVTPALLVEIWYEIPSYFEQFPAFYYPRLPAELTGLSADLVRLASSGEPLDPTILAEITFPRIQLRLVPKSDMSTQVADEEADGAPEQRRDAFDQAPGGIVAYISPHISVTTQVEERRPKMGDIYNIGQAGAAGHGASASNFSQLLVQSGGGPEELAMELQRLREAMKRQATEPEHDVAVAEVAAAELAVKAGDADSTRSHLAKAGRWALATASAIGTAVAAGAIKSALGL